MDDKEYYSLMNKSVAYDILQNLQKKQKKQLPVKKWENQQGREDAEMLVEKQSDSDN